MSNVELIGEAARDPDNVLRKSLGEYDRVIVVGYDHDGTLDIRASTNIDRMELNWLIDQAKLSILELMESDRDE